MRMRELTARRRRSCWRACAAALSTPTPRTAAKARAIYEQLVNTPEGVRYSKPGLQAHISYLGGMTTGVDQKIGRDAIERYQVLKKELDALKAEADQARSSS